MITAAEYRQMTLVGNAAEYKNLATRVDNAIANSIALRRSEPICIAVDGVSSRTVEFVVADCKVVGWFARIVNDYRNGYYIELRSEPWSVSE